MIASGARALAAGDESSEALRTLFFLFVPRWKGAVIVFNTLLPHLETLRETRDSLLPLLSSESASTMPATILSPSCRSATSDVRATIGHLRASDVLESLALIAVFS